MSPEDLSLLLTGRLDDWGKRCDERHHRLDSLMVERNERFERMLTEIHNALYGNGKEGLVERVMRHTQAIKIIQRDVQAIDADMRGLDADMKSKFDSLNVRVWKMAFIVGAIVVSISKAIGLIDVKSIIGI